MLKRVQDAVIARGYVTTRILAEPQDLKSGTLTLTVLPGRIRAIRFSAQSDQRGNAFNAVIGNKWFGKTPSGVEVEGYLSPNTTVFPVYQGAHK